LPNPAEQALARILKGDGTERRTAGAGWLISPRHCLTCAHVVNAGLGRPLGMADPPQDGAVIALDLPNREATSTKGPAPRRTSVICWHPPANDAAAPGEPADIAVLELGRSVALAEPPCLLPPDEAPPAGDPGLGFGFPQGSSRGIVADARLSATAGGLRQINSTGDPQIQPGYSGGPFTNRQQRIIGMIVQRNRTHQTAYLIPVATLERAWPELARLRCGGTDPTLTLRLGSADGQMRIDTPGGPRSADLGALRQAAEQRNFAALHGALFDSTEQRDALLRPARPDAAPRRLQLVCDDAATAALPWHCIEESPGRQLGQAGWIIECVAEPVPGKRRQALVDTLILAPAAGELAPSSPSHVSQVAARLRRLLADPDAAVDRAHGLLDLEASLAREPDLIYVYARVDRDGALILGPQGDSREALTLGALFDRLRRIDPKPLVWLHCVEDSGARLHIAELHRLTRGYPLVWLQRTTRRRATDSHGRTYTWIDALADAAAPEPAAVLSRAPDAGTLCWQARPGLHLTKPKDPDAALRAYIRAALIRLRLGRQTHKNLLNGALRDTADGSLLLYAVGGERDACPHDFPEQARYDLEAGDRNHRVELHWLPLAMEVPDRDLDDQIADALELHLGLGSLSTRQALERLRLVEPLRDERVVIALTWLLEPAAGLAPAQIGTWLRAWKGVLLETLQPADIPPRCRLLVGACIQWPAHWPEHNGSSPSEIQEAMAEVLDEANPHYCDWVPDLPPLDLLNRRDLTSFFRDFAKRPDSCIQGLDPQALAAWCLDRCQGRFEDTVTLIYRGCKARFNDFDQGQSR
jgi:hypothetical protein